MNEPKSDPTPTRSQFAEARMESTGKGGPMVSKAAERLEGFKAADPPAHKCDKCGGEMIAQEHVKAYRCPGCGAVEPMSGPIQQLG